MPSFHPLALILLRTTEALAERTQRAHNCKHSSRYPAQSTRTPKCTKQPHPCRKRTTEEALSKSLMPFCHSQPPAQPLEEPDGCGINQQGAKPARNGSGKKITTEKILFVFNSVLYEKKGEGPRLRFLSFCQCHKKTTLRPQGPQ